MSDTVQIPEDVVNKILKEYPYYGIAVDGYNTYKREGAAFGYTIVQEKIKSFRKKLENITVDEQLKNPGIAIQIFDEHFKIEK